MRYIVLLLVFVIGVSFQTNYKRNWNEDTPLSEVLLSLGDSKPDHFVENPSEEKIQQGKDLFTKGFVLIDGKKSKLQSKNFRCTHCHNHVQEDPDLRKSEPETRLTYAVNEQLPFLQGTTMFGVYNRESWYNDDYVKKYGDMVKPANKSLKESIQLCATECSQGRALEEWEMEAMLAYFWSIQIKLGDLKLTEDLMQELIAYEAGKKANKRLIQELKRYYLQKSPATFEKMPSSKRKGYEYEGNTERGKAIYDLSCRHCHKPGGSAKYLTLDYSKLTFQFLNRKIDSKGRFSIYNAIRKGTYAHTGHRPYMPLYPLQRMSNQQVEDLRSYIEQEANK